MVIERAHKKKLREMEEAEWTMIVNRKDSRIQKQILKQ